MATVTLYCNHCDNLVLRESTRSTKTGIFINLMEYVTKICPHCGKLDWWIEVVDRSNQSVEDEVAKMDKLFDNLHTIEDSYRKHFGNIRPVTERK